MKAIIWKDTITYKKGGSIYTEKIVLKIKTTIL